MSIDQEPDECPHGIFPVESCAICMPKPVNHFASHESWECRRETFCRACGSDICVGDVIHKTREGRILCDDCAE